MLIAEELVQVLYEDETGRARVDSTKLDYVLAGAILVELATGEQIRISEPGEPGVRKGRLVQGSGAPPDDPLLAEAMHLLRAYEGRKPKDALGKLRKLSGGLRDHLLQRLVNAGVLRRERQKLLGIFPITTWPRADPAAEREVRTRLHDVLVTGRKADTRTAALVAMLVAIDQAHKVLGLADRSERRQAKQRAKQIAEGNWASDAVKKAVQEIQTAVVAGGAGGGGDGGGGGGGA